MELEAGFFGCSVKVSTDVAVEKYHDFFVDDSGKGAEFSVKFED